MKRTRDAETSLAESIRAAEPSVAIFDLDSTLWDGNCENFESARMITPEEVVEASSGRSLKLFPDVQKIFAAFHEAGVPIAIASASPASTTAVRLLNSFGLMKHGICRTEVYPGSKNSHLRAIAAALHVPLSSALFFDDLQHNIKAASVLGMNGAVLVRSGVKQSDVRQALRMLRERGRGAALMRAWMGAPKQPPALQLPVSPALPPAASRVATQSQPLPPPPPPPPPPQQQQKPQQQKQPPRSPPHGAPAVPPQAPMTATSSTLPDSCAPRPPASPDVYLHETVRFEESDADEQVEDEAATTCEPCTSKERSDTMKL